jgi:hypothetical protein
MCTVTIIPKGTHDFVLTSNRDEAPNRVSLPPKLAIYNSTTLLYPEDALSGGTWIGVSEHHRLICLLNGGFKIHERQAEYGQSRGLVVKDLLSCNVIETTIENYNFKDIEPFTLVIADWNKALIFYELVWDGKTSHFKQLEKKPHIWSSSTLYTDAMKQERQQWFEDYSNNHELEATSLLKFHKTAGIGNKDYDVVMNRGFVKTTSITQVEKTQDALEMRYHSLQDNLTSMVHFKSLKIVHE